MLSAVVDVFFCRKVMSLSQISGQILKGKQEVSLQAGVDKITASSEARFWNENSSSHPNYINMLISSVFLVISWKVAVLPPCSRTLFMPVSRICGLMYKGCGYDVYYSNPKLCLIWSDVSYDPTPVYNAMYKWMHGSSTVLFKMVWIMV